MSDTDVAYDGFVWVRATPCDACLLSPSRIVDGRRAADLVRSTVAEEGATFICHKSQVSDEPTSICCSWWEHLHEKDDTLMLAVRLGLIARVHDGDTR